MLNFNENNRNKLDNKTQHNLNYGSKQISMTSHDHLREYDMITDYKSTTLNISPEEFTITELHHPEIEETLIKNSSGAFNSLTQHTSTTLKNGPVSVKNANSQNEIPETNLRRQLNKYYNKSACKISSFEDTYYQNHLQLFKDDKIIIQDNYCNKGNEQDDAKIIETEEAEANDLIIHRSPCHNEISSIDLANGIGEISDFWSSDNMTNMILSNEKNAREHSYNWKYETNGKNNNRILKDNKVTHKTQKSSIWLPNMLFFKLNKC